MSKKHVGLTHSKADELLALMVERAEEVNRDPQFMYCVSKLAVFGSYLTDKEKLGDLDIAVELQPKYSGKKHYEMCYEQCRIDGKPGVFQCFEWPKLKVIRALKRRNHAFSLHQYEELEGMVKRGEAVGRELYRSRQVPTS